MKKQILAKAKTQFLILLSLSLFVFTACDDDDEDDNNMNNNTDGNLEVSINNLPASADGEQYEGWIIVDGSPVSTGTFTVDDNGNYSQNSFDVSADQLAAATDFVLTIEPMPDSDPDPSAIKILGGSFSGSMASVSAAHGAALGNDFSSIGGKYILATPTTSVMTDELSGVWFLDLSSGNPAVGLELPTLPSGWKYEGWAVIDGTPVTSGKFSAVDMADDSAPYSGSDADGPPFPGEDFVMNAPAGLSFPTDLSGSAMVISIEPEPDNSAAPFMFKPLLGNVPQGASDHTTYDLMSNVAASFPEGSVSR